MNDPEVVRLRRLRRRALRLRALADAFSATRMGSQDPAFRQLALTSWRIARTVTGRLRSHPNESCQRDASGLSLALYSMVAWLAARLGLTRAAAHGLCFALLRPLSRQLDDARALTWLQDLSDSFGRYQMELRPWAPTPAREIGAEPAIAAAVPGRPGSSAAIEGEWPYLAF